MLPGNASVFEIQQPLQEPNLANPVWLEPFPSPHYLQDSDNDWGPLPGSLETDETSTAHRYSLEAALKLIGEDIKDGRLNPETFLSNLYNVTDSFIGIIEQKGPLRVGDYYSYLSSRLEPISEYLVEVARDQDVGEVFCGTVGGVIRCVNYFRSELDEGYGSSSEAQYVFLREQMTDSCIDIFHNLPRGKWNYVMSILKELRTEKGRQFNVTKGVELYGAARTQGELLQILTRFDNSWYGLNLLREEAFYELHLDVWRKVVMNDLDKRELIQKKKTQIAALVLGALISPLYKLGMTREEVRGRILPFLKEVDTTLGDLKKLGLTDMYNFLAAT